MNLNRRDFGKLALATAAAPSLLSAKPDSVYGGVQIGVITYSFRDMPNAHTDAMAMLKYISDSNASGIEFMNDAAEAYAGSPAAAYAAQGGGGRGMGMGRGGRGASGAMQMSPEQMAQMQAQRDEMMKQQQVRADELRKWRLSVSMDKYKDLRKLYNDAGVSIYAFKLEPLPQGVTDDEMDYIFTVGKTLGATHVTTELPATPGPLSQKWGDFAVKHGMMVGYHAHEQATITAWDGVIAQSKGNGVNLDCGHYYAGTGQSPIPAVQKYAEMGRITSIHLKDRTPTEKGPDGRATKTGANLPWGQGSTPITEILQLVKTKGYKFPASVELEYQVPPGSDSVVEVKKCIEYARKSLA